MRIGASIEARMTSTRLPGKVLMEISGRPALQLMIERVRRSKLIDDVIVATTTNGTDDVIVELCDRMKVKYYRGPEDDVLRRVLEAHRMFRNDIIVELTGDCPLLDPALIDECVGFYKKNDYDYVSNLGGKTPYPIGMNVQVFSTRVLEDVSKKTNDPSDREHVSKYIYTSGEYNTSAIEAEEGMHCSGLAVTLDTPEDLKLIRAISRHFGNSDFTLGDIVGFLRENPDLLDINRHIRRKGLN